MSAGGQSSPLLMQTLFWPPVIPGEGWRRCGEDVCYYSNRYFKLSTASALSPAPEPPAAMDRAGSRGSSDGGDGDSNSGGGPLTSPIAGVPSEVSSAEASGDGDGVNYLKQGSVYRPPAAASSTQQQLYSESWSVTFPPSTKVAFFAYCHPYTFTDLLLDLRRWEDRCLKLEAAVDAPLVSSGVIPSVPAVLLPEGSLGAVRGGEGPPTPRCRSMPRTVGACFTSNVMVRSVLCRSLGGNILPLLTVTDFTASNAAILQRPVVVLSARCVVLDHVCVRVCCARVCVARVCVLRACVFVRVCTHLVLVTHTVTCGALRLQGAPR